MTHEQALQICDLIETAEIGMVKLCKNAGISTRSFYEWLDQDEVNQKRYTRARERQMDMMAESILAISDDDVDDEKPFVGVNHIHRDRLKVDTRKFLMAKLAPKKYGDKIEVEQSGEVVSKVTIEVKERE